VDCRKPAGLTWLIQVHRWADEEREECVGARRVPVDSTQPTQELLLLRAHPCTLVGSQSPALKSALPGHCWIAASKISSAIPGCSKSPFGGSPSTGATFGTTDLGHTEGGSKPALTAAPVPTLKLANRQDECREAQAECLLAELETVTNWLAIMARNRLSMPAGHRIQRCQYNTTHTFVPH